MAITASGVFGLTLEKWLIDTAGESLEAEDNKVMMVTDSATPNFDTHDFENDLNANEVSGTGYTAGGQNLTTTELTLATGTMTFDADDVTWSSSSISNAMASILKTEVGATTTNQLVMLHDFVTAASSSSGDFTIQWHANGLMTIDYTP